MYSQINGEGSFYKGKSPYITPFVSPHNILFALQAYVRDLEEQFDQHDESNLTSSKWIGSLKKEISQYEHAEANFVQHIADLEARLLRADISILDLCRLLSVLRGRQPTATRKSSPSVSTLIPRK